jgi:hypothetical protein
LGDVLLEKEVKMKRNWFIWSVLCILAIVLASCTTAIPTEDANAIGTITAQNVQLTQLAGTLTAVAEVPAQSSTTEIAAAPTGTPMQLATSAATIAPSDGGVWLTFAQPTNCRFGQGQNYALIKVFQTTDRVQAIGVSEDGLYAYVSFNDATTKYCWIQRSLATIEGNLDQLAVYQPQPTYAPPAPTTVSTTTIDFGLSFNGISDCGGNYYVVVTVQNFGWATFKSNRITVVDNDSKNTVTNSSDTFDGYAACGMSMSNSDLMHGEGSQLSNFAAPFTHNIDNHSLTITVVAYTGDGQTGTSVTKTITVVP